jgi:hypothetical protein
MSDGDAQLWRRIGAGTFRWNVASRQAPLSLGSTRAPTTFGKVVGFEERLQQLARRPTQTWAIVIRVRNHASGAIETTFAFGQSGTVLGFNRIARALRVITVRLFGLSGLQSLR